MLTDHMMTICGNKGKRITHHIHTLATPLVVVGTFILSYRLARCLMLALLQLYNLSTSSAQASSADSLKAERQDKFYPERIILPTATLITIGTIGIRNERICDLKFRIKENMDQWRGGKRCHIDNVMQFLPAAAHLGIEYLGIKSKNNLLQRIAASATSFSIMISACGILKHKMEEGRPNSPLAFTSFPSGHTATAFTGAELLRLEYGRTTGIIAYTFASGIAFMRMFNDRHWLNDVIAGAGIGILSAQIGYKLLPLETRIFKLDRKKRNMSITPLYNPSDNHFGLAMSIDI